MTPPVRPASDEMLMIRPCRLAWRCGNAAWLHRNVPVRFTASTRFHSASEIFGERGQRADAGAVDQDIQPTPGSDRLSHGGGDLLRLADVERQRQRRATCRCDLLDDVGSRILIQIGHGHRSARVRKGERDGSSDAGASAGDQGNAILKQLH